MRAPSLILSLALTACGLIGCDGDAAFDAGPRIDAGADAATLTETDAGLDIDGGADAGAMTDAGSAEPTLTVLSLNLHCLDTAGTPFATNPERFAAIAEAVAAEGVDVLLLQEVCASPTEDALPMLQRALEDAGAGAFAAHAVFAHVAWEGTPEEADESVAVLARGLSEPLDLVHATQDGLTRVAAGAEVGTHLGAVWAMSVHFDHRSAPARLAQAREAAVVTLSAAGARTPIVGGDLNTRAATPGYDAFGALGFTDASATAGGDRIDHVFAHRGASLEIVEARRLFDAASSRVSDHPGVLVRWRAGTGDAVTTTTVVAEHDPGAGRHLWLRGDAAPLSWTGGWPMHAVAPGRWRFVSTEWSGAIELKTLIDDATWQTGDNVALSAGDTAMFSPSF